jgi:hypothetical protein
MRSSSSLVGRRARIALGIGFLSGILFAIHCGSSNDSTFSDACSALYGDRCGKACADDTQCGGGLHCAAGRCNAVCGPGRPCTVALACTANGRCLVGGFGEGGNPIPGDDPDSGCADLSVNLTKTTPTILVLVDRSGSMTATFGSGTRWTTLKSVLLDGGVIKSLEGEVNFGLTMYSNPTRSTVGCPDLTGVPFALNNYAAIDGVLAPASTEPDTPTAESILGVAGITPSGNTPGGLAALDAGGGQKIILLVTDGDPDYCQNPYANDPVGNGGVDASEAQKAKDMSVDAVRRAFGAGIKTYVLAIGDEIQATHQQEMANTGLGLSPDAGDAAPFFRPTDEAQLISQINSIIAGVRSCKYTLNRNVQPGFESRGTVRLNGDALPFGDPNGWRLTAPNEIEIQGTACETIKTTANATLTATFPCGSIVN